MDRPVHDYSQTGLPSPYPSSFGDNHSEGSAADHASGAQYPVKQEVSYPTSATPTSEYGVYPQSSRSGTFQEHIQRSYHPATGTGSGGMAQQQNSPSFTQQDGRNHQAHTVHSDTGVPIDPSIAAPSPTYPYGQHSPYGTNPDMTHNYSHTNSGIYAQPRPDWTGYSQHSQIASGHPVYSPSQASQQAQQRPNQVSFRMEQLLHGFLRDVGRLVWKRTWRGCDRVVTEYSVELYFWPLATAQRSNGLASSPPLFGKDRQTT